MNPKRYLLSACVAIPLWSVLHGCGLVEAQPYAWESTPTHKPLPPVKVHVGRYTEPSCYRAGWVTEACAVRDYRDGVCWVEYVDPDLRAETEAHENKHCAGYDHAAPVIFPAICPRT